MNEKRFCHLLRNCVTELELNLAGFRVATSSGSNGYLATPLLAACAGADVTAIAVDSAYGTANELRSATARLWDALKPTGTLAWIADRRDLPQGIDVFTNLGALRPLNAEVLAKASKRAAVTYMCEAWEWREGDVDGTYCKAQGIPIAGHDEDFRGDDVFTSTGELALRMCFEAGLAVRNDCIVVLGADRFAKVLFAAVASCGAKASIVTSAAELTAPAIAAADAVLVCDYRAQEVVLGGRIGPSAAELCAWNPALTIVQFAGAIATNELLAGGLHLYPQSPEPLPPVRMARTLAYLGLRPTLRLMAQGLKVGEMLTRHRDGAAFDPRFQDLVQHIS